MSMSDLLTRGERLDRLATAERELRGARSAYAHGRYATYREKVRRVADTLLPLVLESEAAAKADTDAAVRRERGPLPPPWVCQCGRMLDEKQRCPVHGEATT